MINIPLLREEFIKDVLKDLEDANVKKIIEAEIKTDLIKASILNAFDINISQLHFKDILQLDVKQYYLNEGWFHESYHYNEVVNEIIKSVTLEYIEDYIKYCISIDLHYDFLYSKIVNKVNDELILLQDLKDFCSELYDNDSRFLIHIEDLPIFSSNPSILSFYPPFAKSIVYFKLNLSWFYLSNSSDTLCPNINDFIVRDSILYYRKDDLYD